MPLRGLCAWLCTSNAVDSRSLFSLSYVQCLHALVAGHERLVPARRQPRQERSERRPRGDGRAPGRFKRMEGCR